MQASLVLRAEAVTARNFLNLLLAIPEESDLGTDCAAVARCAFKLKSNPTVFRRGGVPVDEQRAALVSDYYIEHAPVPQINERDRAAIVLVACSNGLRHVHEAARAVIQPDALVLI